MSRARSIPSSVDPPCERLTYRLFLVREETKPKMSSADVRRLTTTLKNPSRKSIPEQSRGIQIYGRPALLIGETCVIVAVVSLNDASA